MASTSVGDASTTRGDIAVERGNTAGPAAQAQNTADEQQSKRKRSRITQACRRCKSRRARCDGVRPVCGECVKGGAVCELPDPSEDGRKRRKSRAPSAAASRSTATSSAADGPQLWATTMGGLQAPAAAEASSSAGESVSPAAVVGPSLNDLLDAAVRPPQPPQPGFNSVQVLADAAVMPPPPTSFDLFAPFASPQADVQRSSPLTAASAATSGLLDSNDRHTGGSGHARPPEDNVPVPPLSYLRPFGPTGIQPGLEQIVISMAAPPAFSRDQSPSLADSFPFPAFNEPASFAAPYNQHGSQIPAFPYIPASRAERFFAEGSDLPRPEIKSELFDVFFRRLSSVFPFLNRRIVDQLDNLELPTSVDAPMLVNSICAVAARFSESPVIKGSDTSRSPGLYGVPFADKAKSMLIPMLGYPSTRTVQSLLLLSWHEFGLNNDGSFWSFSGMALRMAQDLGLHLSDPKDIKHAHLDAEAQAVNRLTWWAVVAHDRMLSLGTGRPVTIKSYEISVPAPTIDDIARVTGADPAIPSAFPTYCQLMLLYGDMCDFVNNVKGQWETAVPANASTSGQAGSIDDQTSESGAPLHQAANVRGLEPLEDAITGAYAKLPPALRWSSLNFRKHHDAGTGPIFLHLHLWYNCVVIMLYGPPLIYPRTKAANMSLADRLSVVTRCCLQISQIIGIADLVDEPDYVAAPFVNQCFFVAISAWIKDHHIRTGRSVVASSASANQGLMPSTDLLAQSATENFDVCRNALARQEKYWLGAGWIGALAGRKGAQASRTSIKTATAGLNTFVSEAEMAIFRRLAARIGGGAQPPEFDNDALSAFLNSLQTDAFANQQHQFTSDDLAMAYTFASTFQDMAQFGGDAGQPAAPPPQLQQHP
ncbi:hypothetical protein Rhopal_006469-T1 [Rhodotorula paludigena]|uniref:Zn(2)-C6 fungal-type domain-containing protein n=1 Tax=Rhodotorula paludigena TaxID=86838 RepID=A0AAV5GSD5_9BASI|nr:hypothetical protein Rhopal_006469-T1 [Rhodotorula paludigena]